ncbi:MAG: tetratricopeptide repeat protein [Bacteroidales bacterium]
MKRYWIILGAILLLSFSACKNNDKKYEGLGQELVKLCKEIDKNPKDAELYYQRATYYYEKGFIEKAMEDISTCIKLNDTKSKYYILLSDVYFAQKETDLTEEMLQKAIEKDPKNNEARLKLAELYFHLRMFKECNTILDEAIKNQTHNPKAHLIRAFCLKEQQDTVGALRMLQLVIDQDPTQVRAFLELGYYYQNKLDPIAISYYQNALNIDPNNVEINYNLAKLYQDLGEIEKAIEQYKILLAINPNNIAALNNLGYIYLVDKDQYEEAISIFTKAIEKDSLFVNAICNRGVAFENLKQYENARQDYLYANSIDETFEPAILGLNRLDKITGNKKR